MAATFIMNVTLSKESAGVIHFCGTRGVYEILVNSESPEGSASHFSIASSNDGQKRIKKINDIPGSNGERLAIIWPHDQVPILTYENDDLAPDEEMCYNLKII